MPDLPGVAPAELIRRDFAMLDTRETLRTTLANEELLLMQSVVGHAHEGHGLFQHQRFSNTTEDHVVRALRRDPMAVKAARQALTDEIRGYMLSALAGMAHPALVDDRGMPLLGISTLRFIQVDPRDVLGGLYLGGLRDDPDIRAEVEAEHNVTIGGGRSYFVDFSQMHRHSITADDLAHGEWERRLDELCDKGIIVDARSADRPNVVYQYIRHRRGCGASDDAAIVGAGFLWGLGVALGVFLADAVDTLEKYVPRYADQDAAMATEIAERFPDCPFGREDVKRLIRVAVASSDDGPDLPDSSLRHLLAIDRHADLCAIEAHILAVQGTPAPRIGLGHDRFPSDKFYAVVRRRIAELSL